MNCYIFYFIIFMGDKDVDANFFNIYQTKKNVLFIAKNKKPFV